MSVIYTLVRLSHQENAPSPIEVTPSPMVTLVRLVQFWNAPLPNPVRTPYKIAA